MGFTNKIFPRRRKYQYIEESQAKDYTASRAIFSTFIICAFMLFASFFLFWNKTVTYYIIISKDTPLLQKTSDKFLSFGLDSSLLRDMQNLPILNERFINLASHLSPAYVRIGGTSADCLFFNQTMLQTLAAETSVVENGRKDISGFTLTGKDFISLNEFTKQAKLRMVFDLNVLRRNEDNVWDDENAREIISFARGHGFELDWQLGNEPNSFFHVFNQSVNAKQLAKDYQKLRSNLDDGGYKDSLIFGPEANHIGDEIHNGALYVQEFLENINNSIDYLTWHQYYLNGRIATVNDFINSTVFNFLPNEIKKLEKVQEKFTEKIPMCISETSTAYGGGAPELSDRFVAGFLWLDKLGYSARTGTKIVIRQSFYGGHYAMIGHDLKPNPDWWLSVAFKTFVSEKVLEFKSYVGNVRLYAHCTPEKSLINRVPAVTVYGLNLNKRGLSVLDFSALQPLLDDEAKIFLYSFTSDSLQSRNIKLNGNVLELDAAGKLPPFKPKIFEADKQIELPNLSMTFVIIHGLNVSACEI